MGASDRNIFEDLQSYTVREFGEAVLSLSKCLEALLKCLCLHLAELAPRDHSRGLHDIRKLGAKSNLQHIVGQQRRDPILGG